MQVFSIKEVADRGEEKKSVWVKAGSAWVNRDGSLNVYLDVLPLDGKLHVREALDEKRLESSSSTGKHPSANGSLALDAFVSDSIGGH